MIYMMAFKRICNLPRHLSFQAHFILPRFYCIFLSILITTGLVMQFCHHSVYIFWSTTLALQHWSPEYPLISSGHTPLPIRGFLQSRLPDTPHVPTATSSGAHSRNLDQTAPSSSHIQRQLYVSTD